MRRNGGSRMFIWVIAVLTAGLLSATLFAMNRSLQNAISPLFDAGRVVPTAPAPTPSVGTSPTPVVMATSNSVPVPPAVPLVGVVFAAGSDDTSAPAAGPAPAPPALLAPKAPAHTLAPKVLAAPRLVQHPTAPVQPAVAAVVAVTPKPVSTFAALAAALHSPTLTASSPDMITLAPLPAATPAIVLPVPRQAHVWTTPTPTPAPTGHHHGDSESNSGGSTGGNGRGNDD